MLPAPFEYHAPKTVDEALGLLDQLGEDAKVLAGGQSLIPLLKLRFANPGHLVDINKIKDLDYLEEREGTLRIGPLFRHKSAERSSLLASRYQVMADAAPQIADPIIRNRGTIRDRSLTRIPPATGERSCSRSTPIWSCARSLGAGRSRLATSSADRSAPRCSPPRS